MFRAEKVWTDLTLCSCSIETIVNPRWRTEGPIGLILHDYQPKVKDTVPADWTPACTEELFARLVSRGVEIMRGRNFRDPGM